MDLKEYQNRVFLACQELKQQSVKIKAVGEIKKRLILIELNHISEKHKIKPLTLKKIYYGRS